MLLYNFNCRACTGCGCVLVWLIDVIVAQIQALLADRRVKEALELARNATNIGLKKEKFQKVSWTFYVRAAR